MAQLVALVARPKDLERAMAVLTERGLAPAEARMRLAPEPPSPVLRLDATAAAALASALTAAGAPALAIDPDSLPDAFLARSFELGPAQATFIARDGTELEIGYGALRLLLRGVRATQSESIRIEKTRKFSLSKAVLTQGLLLTKVEKREVRSTVTQAFHVAVAFGASGDGTEQTVLLDEAELTYQSLGNALKPARVENLNTVVGELRKRAATARYDDRLLRIGTRALPLHEGDPFDLLAELLNRAQLASLW